MITASGLTKRYGSVTVVDGLSFTVEPGRVTGFLGPNGSGKTTTMRMILGLDRPSSGTATIRGVRYRDLASPLRTVGALLDPAWVHARRSARTHLMVLARSNRVPTRRVDEVLDLVGLGGVVGGRAGALSLGMRQRLGIAAALLGDPGVLILDEPFNGLDPEGIRWLRSLMSEWAAQGRTVLVSSHQLAEMATTASDLVVISRGRLIAQQPVAGLVGVTGVPTVRVRSPDATALADALRDRGHRIEQHPGEPVISIVGPTADQVGTIAAAHGFVLHELTAQPSSLEEAFLRMTAPSIRHEGPDRRSGRHRAGGQVSIQPARPSLTTEPHHDEGGPRPWQPRRRRA